MTIQTIRNAFSILEILFSTKGREKFTFMQVSSNPVGKIMHKFAIFIIILSNLALKAHC